MEHFKNDKEAMELYRLREKALLDYNSGISFARREGFDEGKLEVALTMIADGEPIEKIMKYTGLTLEEIEEL